MNKFVFENSTKVYFGEECVKEHLPRLLAEYRGDVMLAYGGGSIKRNGAYEDIMEVLKGAGRNVVEFTGIMANPTYAKVMEGAALARAERIGLIRSLAMRSRKPHRSPNAHTEEELSLIKRILKRNGSYGPPARWCM